MKNIPIKVSIGTGPSAKKFDGTKRVWETSDLGNEMALTGISNEEVIKRLNYAEDLFVRRDVRTANTDSGQKTKHRAAAMTAVLISGEDADKAEFLRLNGLVAADASQAKVLNAWLDSYYADNLDESADDEAPTE